MLILFAQRVGRLHYLLNASGEYGLFSHVVVGHAMEVAKHRCELFPDHDLLLCSLRSTIYQPRGYAAAQTRLHCA